MLPVNKLDTWTIFLGFAMFGMVTGFIIGAWFITKHDLLDEAEKIAMEAIDNA